MNHTGYGSWKSGYKDPIDEEPEDDNDDYEGDEDNLDI